jgi:hypothetical protein
MKLPPGVVQHIGGATRGWFRRCGYPMAAIVIAPDSVGILASRLVGSVFYEREDVSAIRLRRGWLLGVFRIELVDGSCSPMKFQSLSAQRVCNTLMQMGWAIVEV